MALTTRLAFLALIVAMSSDTAFGHNLFILVKTQADKPDIVDVIFEHAPRPGKGGYNKPLLQRGKTWVRTLDGKNSGSLKLTEVGKAGKKHLRATTKSTRPRVVVHSVKWGLYRGRLDYFHGKYIDVASADQLKKLARTKQLPLDIVPSVAGNSLSAKVFFNGKPVANKSVSVWAPNGKVLKYKTDSDGEFRIASPKAGCYSLTTYHTQKDRTGKEDGKAYKGLMHGSSCTLNWPIKQGR